MQARRVWLLMCVVAMQTFSGCALLPQTLAAEPPRFKAVPATVFVADGAGNFQMTSKSLRKVLEKDGYPIEIVTFEWSHGHRRIIADLTDYAHARCQGALLAATVEAYHKKHPDRPIYLVGHSAGVIIVLAALEHLAPNVTERAVLMAPSVSACYDIRPALRAVKQDMTVFYSSQDWYYLGIHMRLLGTCDRVRGNAAGYVGFRPCADPEDPGLLHKLIQRSWQPADRELGNNGGHFGTYQPAFLRAHIIPLLNPR